MKPSAEKMLFALRELSTAQITSFRVTLQIFSLSTVLGSRLAIMGSISPSQFSLTLQRMQLTRLACKRIPASTSSTSAMKKIKLFSRRKELVQQLGASVSLFVSCTCAQPTICLRHPTRTISYGMCSQSRLLTSQWSILYLPELGRYFKACLRL